MHMDLTAMIHTVEGPKPNPKNPDNSSLYNVTLRSMGSDKKVTEAPLSLWFNPKLKNRFESVLQNFPVSVSVLGVYVSPGKKAGEVSLSLSDNGRISAAKTSATEQLQASQGSCLFSFNRFVLCIGGPDLRVILILQRCCSAFREFCLRFR